MIFLTLPELLHIAQRTLGPDYAVRDYGLLEAALARPQATAFGKDAYTTLDAKAAALLHSLARNHALIDGNKRLALAALIAFYGLNGRRLRLTNDSAYELVMSVAAGHLDTVHDIATILQHATEPWANALPLYVLPVQRHICGNAAKLRPASDPATHHTGLNGIEPRRPGYQAGSGAG